MDTVLHGVVAFQVAQYHSIARSLGFGVDGSGERGLTGRQVLVHRVEALLWHFADTNGWVRDPHGLLYFRAGE